MIGDLARERVRLTVNGQAHELDVPAHALLLDVLRDRLDLKGAKRSCDIEVCGACTVLVDGVPRYACMTLALEAEGHEITTVEGLLAGEELGPVQRAFVESGGIQCGFCSPGMIMATEALLTSNPEPSDPEIRKALVGNLCRCTGYVQIVDSVRLASKLRSSGGGGDE